jgi:hypothetical protein
MVQKINLNHDFYFEPSKTSKKRLRNDAPKAPTNEACALICENLCHLWLKTTPPQAEADHFEQVLCNETIFESALRAR